MVDVSPWLAVSGTVRLRTLLVGSTVAALTAAAVPLLAEKTRASSSVSASAK